MALSPKLQLRQSQSLVMTPQLMQSIRLLQLTHLELDRFVDDEIERNPLLERVPESDTGEKPDRRNLTGGDSKSEESWSEQTPDWSSRAISEKLDTSLENMFPDDTGVRDRIAPDLSAQWRSAGGTASRNTTSDSHDLEDFAAAKVTLRDHVIEQIAFGFADPGERLIANELADSLDEAGYIPADFGELTGRLDADAETVTAVLEICRTFDPPGIFARDLAECLALQLRIRDRYDPAMQALIANLGLLARRDFQALRRICGVDEEDLLDMLAEIRALDPKPGMAFSSGPADPVVPDVIVKPAGDGSWSIELNPDALPRVLIDRDYYAEVSVHARSKTDREFLADCLQSANWLTRSLDQRARTVLKVTAEIVKQQDAFLISGIRHLKPLNLRTVADAIDMHESTVSRVTSNKYVLTPRGVFELRFFFTAAIASSAGGESHSSEAVRDRIRELIEAEKPVSVLSDDAIVDLLGKSGVEIARRTVAKYREGMNIPSSVQRRREKRALAGVES